MKKNIIKLLLCSLAILSLDSCRDALDIEQEGLLSNEAIFRSTDDMNRYLQGDVYSRLSITSQIGFTSQFTDEVGIGSSFTGFGVGVHQFYVDISTDEASAIWLSNYAVINRVVRLIEGAKLVPVPTDDTGLRNYNAVIAQARALRAFSYLQLLSYYSTNMKDPNALGVIILDHIPTTDEQLPRSTNREVFDVIESDLNYAESNIIENSSQYYVSKSFINAVKARFYLYTGNHALAKVNAENAISASGLSLTIATPVPTQAVAFRGPWHRNLNANSTTTSPYVKMLQDTERGEVIFALSRPVAGAWENISNLYNINSSTKAGSTYDMGRNLFNILRDRPGDVRKYAYIDPTVTFSKLNAAGEPVNNSADEYSNDYLTDPNYRANDVLPIDKYPGKSTTVLRNDVKVFRVAEMYLILAECAVAENRLSDAANYVKMIRDARSFTGVTTAPSYTSVADAWAGVLQERRVELAFEGHRYIDLKRIGNLANRAIDRSIVDDINKENPLTIANDDFRFTLPIPRNELQANQVIQQNPGYKATP